ncbi:MULTISPECIES: AAA family ATPase [Acinetobacter calcoaceticus/baumannii complex]|uniref:AAA family ATPase n=1 Tax=Acinetobacter calcoaceticus/baumannii complex TaxID=909768 RepID=UPI0022EB09EF|nr:AAA family ATPase [Acinetobacter baumannii]MDA3433856.1 AAA family ATPase [Acinetobacter baumannii]
MKITKISLTNFRAFKQTQTIEFAPVTLLFGPNSVGKSTVLKALFYVQQILSKGQCNPMYLDALNKKYIGGFENLVHKRDLDTNITLKIEYDKGDAIGSSYAYLYELLSEELDIQLSSPVVDAKTIAIEFEIAWHKFEKTAYIKTYRVEFDGDIIAEVTSSGPKQAFLTFLNYIHPLLLPANHEEWLQVQKDSEANLHPYNRLLLDGVDVYENHDERDQEEWEKLLGQRLLEHFSPLYENAIDEDELLKVLEAHLHNYAENHIKLRALLDKKYVIEDEEIYIEIDNNKFGFAFTNDSTFIIGLNKNTLGIDAFEFLEKHKGIGYSSNNYFVSALHELINLNERNQRNMISIQDHREYSLLHNVLSIETVIGALPPLSKKIRTDLELDTIKHNEIITELLSDVLVAPLDNLFNLLNESLCIGPIRKIPDANYQPLPYIEQADWYDGSAAWSMLEKATFAELKEIHKWMSDQDKLDLGYGISVKVSKVFDLHNPIYATHNIESLSPKIDELISWHLGDQRIREMGAVLDGISEIENRVIDPANEDEYKRDFEQKALIKQYRKLEKEESNLELLIENLQSKNEFENNSTDLKSFEILKQLDEENNELQELLNNRSYDEVIAELTLKYEKIKAERYAVLAQTDFMKLDFNEVIQAYSIWDQHNDISVEPNEIGTGVSQLMPLVVAAVTQKSGLVACEQPELHLHPRVQVAIGDLLSQNTEHVNYLIETHSEHLILRLRRRIRQNTDNELPVGLKAFSHNEVVINYLEPSKDGVQVRRIRMDEDGEFRQPWPNGFFHERLDEAL